MKKLINFCIFGNNGLVSGLITLAVVGSIALGCNCGKAFNSANIIDEPNRQTSPTPDPKSDQAGNSVPANAKLQILVKETTAQFADAIDTGDFTELYSKSSPDFQNTFTIQQTKDTFKVYLDNRSRVLPRLRSTANSEAIFSPAPSIRTEKGVSILSVKGKFQSKPVKIPFEYEYVWRGGEWKMLKIKI